MTYTKIIYLRYIPLTNKVYEDFYFQSIINNKIELEYWDLSKIYFPDMKFNENNNSLVLTKTLNSYSEFKDALKQSINTKDSVLFISLMTFELRIARLYFILNRYNCTLAVFGKNVLPRTPTYKENNSKILLKIKEIVNQKKLMSLLLSLKLLKPYDIIFQAGSEGWRGLGQISLPKISKAKIIRLNSDDYDRILNEVNTSRQNGSYILFLDMYLPYHPDTVLFNIPTVDPVRYFKELNSFFNTIELRMKMPVIIAAHPKASKYMQKNYFEGRKIVFNNTSNYVVNAELILSHDSTSVSLAIASSKKIHFITSKEIESKLPYIHSNILQLSKDLGQSISWYDNVKNIEIFSNIDNYRYNQFKYKYLTWPETQATSSEIIFSNFITR